MCFLVLLNGEVLHLHIDFIQVFVFFFFWKPNSFVIYYWVWVQSNYKASIAGGGESSNQISSSSTYLAYLANEWATKFALPCTIQVPEASIVYCAECDPMDNSVKPASIANSKAFPTSHNFHFFAINYRKASRWYKCHRIEIKCNT